MSGPLIGVLIAGALLLSIVLVFVGMYNALVAIRNRVRNAWSQIDVQLKRRYDLIPNLVETVKGYAKHEREVFENVTKARAACLSAAGPADAAKAEGTLSQSLKSLFAVAEAYPELKANQNFLALQGELASTENGVSSARQLYNDTVMRYNTKIQTVPMNIMAGMFGFKAEEFFQVEGSAERVAPKVQF